MLMSTKDAPGVRRYTTQEYDIVADMELLRATAPGKMDFGQIASNLTRRRRVL